MGLFKQFAKDILNQVVNEAKGQMSYYNGSKSSNTYPSNDQHDQQRSKSFSEQNRDDIPSEENQYNYNGPFTEYFENIFNEEFPEYSITWKKAEKYTAYIYTFTLYGDVKLIVELLPGSSSAKALRERCRSEGTPYLRYYYDVDGWWNTRAYVIGRTKNALGY